MSQSVPSVFDVDSNSIPGRRGQVGIDFKLTLALLRFRTLGHVPKDWRDCA